MGAPGCVRDTRAWRRRRSMWDARWREPRRAMVARVVSESELGSGWAAARSCQEVEVASLPDTHRPKWAVASCAPLEVTSEVGSSLAFLEAVCKPLAKCLDARPRELSINAERGIVILERVAPRFAQRFDRLL